MESRVEKDLRLSVPHLLNLNVDPLLTGAICHFLPDRTVTRFGSRAPAGSTDKNKGNKDKPQKSIGALLPTIWLFCQKGHH